MRFFLYIMLFAAAPLWATEKPIKLRGHLPAPCGRRLAAIARHQLAERLQLVVSSGKPFTPTSGFRALMTQPEPGRVATSWYYGDWDRFPEIGAVTGRALLNLGEFYALENSEWIPKVERLRTAIESLARAYEPGDTFPVDSSQLVNALRVWNQLYSHETAGLNLNLLDESVEYIDVVIRQKLHTFGFAIELWVE